MLKRGGRLKSAVGVDFAGFVSQLRCSDRVGRQWQVPVPASVNGVPPVFWNCQS